MRNNYLNNSSDNNNRAYNKQRNCCVAFKKTEKNYYANLNEKGLNDNKQFWRTVKLSHLSKTKSSAKTTLVRQR